MPFACLIVGDSIALGTASALRAGGMACSVAAKVGASAAQLTRQIASAGARPVTIVSAGTNDHTGPALEANLLSARLTLGRARVVWILPYRRDLAYTISQIALRFDDGLVDLARVPSRDRIHPMSYAAVARLLLR